jgi:signal transduction histidine kinase
MRIARTGIPTTGRTSRTRSRELTSGVYEARHRAVWTTAASLLTERARCSSILRAPDGRYQPRRHGGEARGHRARGTAEAGAAAKDEAERQSLLKDEFATLSHELRTPMNAILMALDPRERQADSRDPLALAVITRNAQYRPSSSTIC